jgi:hypothetical protein
MERMYKINAGGLPDGGGASLGLMILNGGRQVSLSCVFNINSLRRHI